MIGIRMTDKTTLQPLQIMKLSSLILKREG